MIPLREAPFISPWRRARSTSDAILGLVWMDAQGHEAHILSGAEVLHAPDIPIVTEYWPQGLRHAGAGSIDCMRRACLNTLQLVAEIEPSPGGPPRPMTIDELIALEGERTGRSGARAGLGLTLILSRKLSLAAG